MKYTPEMIKANTETIQMILIEVREHVIKKQSAYFAWQRDASLHHPILNVFKAVEKAIEDLDFTSSHHFYSVRKLAQLGESISKIPELKCLHFERCLVPIAMRLRQYVAIDLRLEHVETLQKTLKAKGNNEAAEAVNTLLVDLCTLTYDYFVDKRIDASVYRAESLARIEAYPALKKSEPDYKRLLLNLLLCVCTVLIGFLIAASLHKARSGEFLFFKTNDPVNPVLDELKKVVEFSAKPLFIREPCCFNKARTL